MARLPPADDGGRGVCILVASGAAFDGPPYAAPYTAAKGGIVVRIVRELKVPVKLIGLGERLEDLQPFEPQVFVDALVAET